MTSDLELLDKAKAVIESCETREQKRCAVTWLQLAQKRAGKDWVRGALFSIETQLFADLVYTPSRTDSLKFSFAPTAPMTGGLS